MKWLLLFILLVVLLLLLVEVARRRMLAYLPRNRVRSMRWRLHFGMHPGRGFASLFELWLRWGRLAAFRSSKRIRPSLSTWQRIRHPDEFSVKLGRARRMSLRVPLEEHVLVMAPPRTGKTALLSTVIMHHRGPCLATSSKPDLFALTSGVRSKAGPVVVFNPGRVGGLASTMQWSPIDGCEDRSVAMRRADSFANAISMSGSENGDYFAGKASSYLRALFHASALTGGDLRLVARWALGSAEQAEQILIQAGAAQWAEELAELRGEAKKSAATTQSVMSRALSFMNDDALAQAVISAGFDIPEFLAESGTLYMIAEAADQDNPLSALFACLANEFRYAAAMTGQAMPGGRLDPPLRMALDEIVSICPVPLPVWLSDSGGKGISILSVSHGEAQLRSRWGPDGAQSISDCSGVKVYLPGITDTHTLEAVSKAAGTMSQVQHGEDHHNIHPVITEGMTRSLPGGYGLLLRGGNTACIAKMERGWKQRAYKRARRHGEAVAALLPVQERPSIQAAQTAPEKPLDALQGSGDGQLWWS